MDLAIDLFAVISVLLIGADIWGLDVGVNLRVDQLFLAVLTVLLKGTLAGILPALLFRAVARKNRYVAAFAAAACAPIVNTGVFVLGCLCMYDAVVASVGSAFGAFIALIMINFAIELGVNLVLAPAIYSVDRIVEKRLSGRGSMHRSISSAISRKPILRSRNRATAFSVVRAGIASTMDLIFGRPLRAASSTHSSE